MSQDEKDQVEQPQQEGSAAQDPEDMPDATDEAGEGADEGNGPTKASVFDSDADDDAVVTDLATSGRDTALAGEDAETAGKDDEDERKQVSEHRQAQADRATGGGGQGVHDALTGPSSAALNPSVYPVEEDQKQYRGIDESADEGDNEDSEE